MPTPIIVHEGGSITGNLSVGRIRWSEPVCGTLRVTDGQGNTLASLSYSGSGYEPDALTFNPAITSRTGINILSPGGDCLVYCQGASGFGS